MRIGQQCVGVVVKMGNGNKRGLACRLRLLGSGDYSVMETRTKE